MTAITADLEIQAMRALLLSKLLSYPDADTANKVADLALAAELRHALGSASEPWGVLAGAVETVGSNPEGFTTLAAEYIDLFDRGMAKASLHETEYGQPLSKGNKLADLAGFYQAFGFTFRADQAEMVDHIAVELEFYALLLLKHATLLEQGDAAGCEIVLDARRKFFDTHMGSLLCTLAEQPRLQGHPTLGPVVGAARALADAEALALGLQEFSATAMSVAPPESETMECDTTQSRFPVVN